MVRSPAGAGSATFWRDWFKSSAIIGGGHPAAAAHKTKMNTPARTSQGCQRRKSRRLLPSVGGVIAGIIRRIRITPAGQPSNTCAHPFTGTGNRAMLTGTATANVILEVDHGSWRLYFFTSGTRLLWSRLPG